MGVIDFHLENNNKLIKFYCLAGPRTLFKMSQEDEVWVPLTNVLRKLCPSEIFTATGRSYNVTHSLCEEILLLLNKHAK